MHWVATGQVNPNDLFYLTGLIAINEINRKPGLHGLGRAIFGIVAGTIGTVVLVAVLIIG